MGLCVKSLSHKVSDNFADILSQIADMFGQSPATFGFYGSVTAPACVVWTRSGPEVSSCLVWIMASLLWSICGPDVCFWPGCGLWVRIGHNI